MRAWLLVEVPGSWGRDAVVESELGPHAPAVWREAMRRRGIRVITIRRDLDRSHRHPVAAARLVHVVAGRPGHPAVAHRRTIDDLHHVVSATESLASGAGPGDGWHPDDDLYVLVCTNGRHDACCATRGRPLVRGLRDSPWRDHVWECSHIGGDRFAGNVLLLPESLYFGRCERPDVDRLLAAHTAGRLDLSRFRGRSALSLPEQAAEHFVRAEQGLDGLDDVTAIAVLDDGRVRVDVSAGGRSAAMAVDVRRGRAPAPTPLTCKGRDGLTYPTFALGGIAPLG